jgi:class 3 adenylate cyclase
VPSRVPPNPADEPAGSRPDERTLEAIETPHEGGARLTGDEVVAINRFPDDNPNPVLRMDADGHLIYANPASAGVRKAMGAEVGDRVPQGVIEQFEAAAPSHGFVELSWDDRTYAVWPVPIEDLDFTNLYGTDVTAERAIVKFPDQNPNPVLRLDWSGALLYANAASDGLVRGLDLAVGSTLPEPLRTDIVEQARRGQTIPIEADAAGRIYALVAVDVTGFGFINVYGTEVTAVREIERLAADNERLLLNILPEPIARRLRDGEHLIADRFEDVTLLFADIVEFTRLSSTMSPSELVGVLNEIFTVFDALVDRYELEKVKTIGDAYMVVGGLPVPTVDHTARVAGMALDLANAVEAIEAAARLGIAFRIGIHIGPVVAGVIGTKKFIYDVWGDTVNLASRMESLGVPGRVQVTGAVMERLGDAFTFESRGLVEVKGKGPTPTWFLTGRTASGSREAPDAETRAAAAG